MLPTRNIGYNRVSMDRQDFIFSSQQLAAYLKSNGKALLPSDLSQEAQAPFYLLIPKYYVDLIDWTNPHDPLKKMVVPNNLEDTVYEYEMTDPIGDHSHEPVPGIAHRYPDRCLLMLTNICAVHCRFCFRKNLLDTNQARYEEAMQYIEQHPELSEVILSGGDPFMLTDYFLKKITDRLNTVKHVKVIRFHTRTPAVYPNRVTDQFLESITSKKQVVVVNHINHPREITQEFVNVVQKMNKSGIMLLSQTVLMKDINNSAETLAELFKGLVEIGVKPYYLHHLDPAAGTHHFRISVDEGKRIYQSLRGTIPGHCIPEYVIDTPGGHGKIPVMWFTKISENEYEAVNFEGKKIRYTDCC